MTRYEQLTHKMELCYDAAHRCQTRGNIDMVELWLAHYNNLLAIRGRLSIEDAEEMV